MRWDISTSWAILARLGLYGAIVAFIILALPDPVVERLEVIPDVGIWIYALLLVFLVEKGITRKDTLRENVLLELTHLRHIHHVTEAIGDAKLLASVDAAIRNYQVQIKENFLDYRKGSSTFREISHQIYTYRPKEGVEETLHEDLLQTVRELAVVRQYIIHNLYKQLAPFYWIMVLLTLVLVMCLFLIDFNTMELRRFGLWMSIFVLYIPMEMFIRTSQSSRRTTKHFESLYAKNVEKIKDVPHT